MTQEIAYQALQDFFTDIPFIMFAMGTSCAVDLGFGMPDLEKHLRSTGSKGTRNTKCF
ncbi:MAG: hypothetical protein V7735_19985 [Photobacterium frigidiphilum]|uniref:hypothetical protein n=1 Tax=Photobacterium frigidiphilum TaxID=264736 RepID=UPI003001DA3C